MRHLGATAFVLLALLLAAACSPADATFTLWRVDRTYPRGAPAEAAPEREVMIEDERQIEGRAACEVMLDRKVRSATETLSRAARTTSTDGGVIYILSGQLWTTTYQCLPTGKRPEGKTT